MKVSRTWLQKYFDTDLPDAEGIAQALTFHSSEVEDIAGDMLDVKILPDRAGYALCHRGIAYELGAALGIAMAHDPLSMLGESNVTLDHHSAPRDIFKNTISPNATSLHLENNIISTISSVIPGSFAPTELTPTVSVSIEDPEKCSRFMVTHITGLKVMPSPDWLRQALESVGQRSINNIVDATNYAMLDIGQPLHAYDASKLSKNTEGKYALAVRASRAGEKITTLSGDTRDVPEGTTVIADAAAGGTPLGIAGIKGGKVSEITSATTDILIEAATFDASSTRKSAQALKLFTDASLRYQNTLSPELAAYGMRAVADLILSIAGGEIAGAADTYPNPPPVPASVTITRDAINGILGSDFSTDDMLGVLQSLQLPVAATGNDFMVMPPFYRADLMRPEDFSEEIGRILGYDRIEPKELEAMKETPDQKRALGIERLKDFMIDHGFTEISTQAFAPEGERKVLKPMQQDKPALRTSLTAGMQDALSRGAQVAPRVLGPGRDVMLFEIGSIFLKEEETLSLAIGYKHTSAKYSPTILEEVKSELSDMLANLGQTMPEVLEKSEGIIEMTLEDGILEAIGDGYTAREITLSPYVPFSPYPSALRDIAVWTPRENSEGLPTEQSEVESVIAGAAEAQEVEEQGGEYSENLLVRLDLFDRFEKDDRISYAFRLVFQSKYRTLSDADLDPLMEKVSAALAEKDGWAVR